MNWKKNLLDVLSDALRFVVRGIMLINGLMLAVFILLFSAKFLWRLHEWLDVVFLGQSWAE